MIYHLALLHNTNKDKDDFPVNIKSLKKKTVSDIHLYIAYLKRQKLILCDDISIKGKKSFHYNLSAQYLTRELIEIEIIY